MNVLVFTNTLYPRGGADIAAIRQAKALYDLGYNVVLLTTSLPKELHLRGIRIKLISVEDWSKINSPFGRIIRLCGFFYSVKVNKEVHDILENENIDLAIGHLLKGHLTVSILVALRKHDIPVIRVLHDYELLDPHNLLLNGQGRVSTKTVNGNSFWSVLDRHNRNSLILSFLSWLEYVLSMKLFPVKDYAALVPVSTFSFQIHRSSRLNLPHIEVIPNFISHDYVKLNEPNEPRQGFIYFGRLSKEKGLSTLLSAFEYSKLQCELSIVGSGSAGFKKSEGINFVGPKYGTELFQILNRHRYMVLPSEWYENNPLSVLEAMLIGIPCIVADIGGLSELVINGYNGFLFESGSSYSLQKALLSAESMSDLEYKEMSNNCKHFIAENYSKNTYSQSWMNLIDKVCPKEIIK